MAGGIKSYAENLKTVKPIERDLADKGRNNK
jgi:hypothetical protein